jgi:glycogen phosphorylase
MQPVGTFRLVPALPPALEPLRELAFNLWWAWNHPAIELFRRLDDELWQSSGHNPVALLGSVDQQRLEQAAGDAGYMALLDRVVGDLRGYLADRSTWFARTCGPLDGPLAAYFSAEFGLTECVSIFAGGLGLLAGDHLKSASDLGLPLVGVGLLYQEGTARQYLNEAGWQQEAYVDNDFHTLPLTLERGSDGAPVTVALPFPNRPVVVQIWRAQVGRVPLYLLDTNVAPNSPTDRVITNQLYGGDLETRLQQEIVLGIGGHRALEALDLHPLVYHMNEGHSAFLALDRMRRLAEVHRLPFRVVRELAGAGLVFTTHTPVAAGHDYFPAELLDRYLAGYPRATGLSRRRALGLGRLDPSNERESFGMTILALRMAAHSTAVSRLHGRVSRQMWQSLWPGVPEDEVPINHVTNAIHTRSWVSREMDRLYERYLGQGWWEQSANGNDWQHGIARIPGEELWRTHELRRERLVVFARRRLRRQFEQRSGSRAAMEQADQVLDLDALTIGFARRFATYKRATLVLSDPDRLARLLNDPKRPVQILFAGKAHPRDEPGKVLIQQIVRLAQDERFRRRLVFLEDYDMAMARALVQGCDVWLNTPRRPLEASGTSGMKAAANGVLNVSTLDGWWDEAWSDLNQLAAGIGWAIGRGESYASADEQDQVEAEALYDLLERDVVPTFYARAADGLPQQWIERMKGCISSLVPMFNGQRMVREYAERCYLPAAAQVRRLAADDMAAARALAAWRERIEQAWPQLAVQAVAAGSDGELRVGDTVDVRAWVQLGGLSPEDVAVELYLGRVDARGALSQPVPLPMRLVQSNDNGCSRFETAASPGYASGLHGYTVRVLPNHPDLTSPFQPGLVTWAASTTPAGGA